MAALEKIRNKAGLLVGAVGLALFAFIIGDGLQSGSTWFQNSKETVLKINGQAVKIEEYSRRINEMTEIYTMNSGSNLTEEESVRLRNDVFETMIREQLMEDVCDQVGLAVTSEEMFDLVQGENVSPMIQQMFRNESGMFDRGALLGFLQQTISNQDLSNYSDEDRSMIESRKKYWLFLEKTLKQQKLEEKFGGLLANIIVVNKLDAQAEFEESQGSVDFDYVVKNYNSLPDSLFSVSNSEINDLYNRRKAAHKQEKATEIKYITVAVTPSEADFAEVESTLNGIKQEMQTSDHLVDVINDNSDVPFYDVFSSQASLSAAAGNFVRTAQIGDLQGPQLVGNTFHIFKYLDKTIAPDSVRINELRMPPLAEAQMKQITDSLVGVLKGGKAFSELAMELSGNRSNGDAGWFTDEQALRNYDDRFRDAVFAATINNVFTFKSSKGTHIVQVTEKTKPVEKFKVADLAVSVLPSTRTTTEAYTKLSQYILKNKTLETFESEALAAGYFTQRATVSPNQQLLAGIPSTRPVIRWAFENKKGAVSEIFECDENRYVVAMIEAPLEKGYRSVAAITDILKRELINNKKAEKIIADAKDLGRDSLQQAASVWNTPVQSVKFVNFATRQISGLGSEPALNATAPVAELNQISQPVKGDRGVFLFNVTQKNPSTAEFNLDQQKQMMAAQNSYRYMYQAMQSLRDNADIEDFRIRFY